MPLYEYQCPQCGRFELIRKFSDRPLKKCPTCGKTVQKLASAPAIQFKGSGWYVTDYAAKSGAKERKDDAKADSAAKDAAKGESAAKPAGKADSASAASEPSASKPAPAKDSPAPSDRGSSKKKSA